MPTIDESFTGDVKRRGSAPVLSGANTFHYDNLAGTSLITMHRKIFGGTGPYPWPDRAVSIQRRYVEQTFRSNGILYGNVGERQEFRDAMPTFMAYTAHDFPSVTSPPNWDFLKTKALAGINFNRPVVDIPVFAFELRELPRMAQGLGEVLAGRVKPSDVAGGYLAYSFGWGPLFGDFYRLLNLAKYLEQRRKRLAKATKGRIGGNIGEDTSKVAIPHTFLWGRGSQVVYYHANIEIKWKYWYSARLRMKTAMPPVLPPQVSEIMNALGLIPNPATLWAALPWSWLIDYFINVADWLDAHRYGPVSYKVTSLCVMAHGTSKKVTQQVPTKWNMVSTPGLQIAEDKLRRVFINPIPTLTYQPWWTDHQTLIIGSLVTAKALKALGS